MNSIAHLKRSISLLEAAAQAAIDRKDFPYAEQALRLSFEYHKKIEIIVTRALIGKK